MFSTRHFGALPPVPRRNKFLSMLLLYITYVWVMIHTYDFQIAEQNAYGGMQPWEMTFVGWVLLIIALPLIAFMASRIKGNPSDFFLVFYSAIPLISLLALTSTSGKINNFVLLPALLVLTFPLFATLTLRYLMPKIRWSGVVSSNIVERVLLGILFLTILFSYFKAPASASFDVVSNEFDRRLDGREIYTDGSLIAYVLQMCMNGFAPYLAFRSAFNGRILVALIAFGAAVFFYWLLAVKAPLAFVLVGYLIGLLAKRKALSYLVKYFLFCTIGLYLLVLLEWWFFDNVSVIANYGIRRLFAVPAQLQGYYLDFLMVDTPSAWNWLIGVQDRSFQVTFFIGEKYLGSSASNANTNAFLYAFAANGFWGYLVAVLFVSTLLVLLDSLYRSTRNPAYLFIGFIYGLLVCEQSFSTAMVSSGVGMVFFLTLLEKNESSVVRKNMVVRRMWRSLRY